MLCNRLLTTSLLQSCQQTKLIVKTIGSPESHVFILVALARVNASNWFNIYEKPIGCFSQQFGCEKTVAKNSQSAFQLLFKKMTTQAGE